MLHPAPISRLSKSGRLHHVKFCKGSKNSFTLPRNPIYLLQYNYVYLCLPTYLKDSLHKEQNKSTVVEMRSDYENDVCNQNKNFVCTYKFKQQVISSTTRVIYIKSA